MHQRAILSSPVARVCARERERGRIYPAYIASG
jgi:hypothetical protein